MLQLQDERVLPLATKDGSEIVNSRSDLAEAEARGRCTLLNAVRGTILRATVMACVLASSLTTTQNLMAADPIHPLQPLDTSSPQATLLGFLEVWDEFGRFWRDEYRAKPSRHKHHRGTDYGAKIVRALDTSDLPPASRREVALAAAACLYDVLCKIELPPDDAIPDDPADLADQRAIGERWTVPHTEITIARMVEGPDAGEYRFTAQTVSRAQEFYLRTGELPYRRVIPVEDWPQVRRQYGGWMFPPSLIDKLPGWLRVVVWGKAVWGWVAGAGFLAVLAATLALIFRVAFGRPRQPTAGFYLRRLSAPLGVICAALATQYFFDQQLSFTDLPAKAVDSLAYVAVYLSVAWALWYLAFGLAEAIIASPKISDESLDAHLLRMGARTIGIAGFGVLVVYGASHVGVPIFGLITGAGIFGLAIALAAQDTLKAFLGSVTIFLDQPYKVGQRIRALGHDGFVESIGMRSTRIRLLDGHLTSIPNEMMAAADIENIGRRPHIRRRFSVTITYDTPPAKIERAMEILRDILAVRADDSANPHPNEAINHSDFPPRVYFDELNSDSLNLLVIYWYHPPDYWSYLEHATWVNTQIMQRFRAESVEFAFPTQTLHLASEQKRPMAEFSGKPTDIPTATLPTDAMAHSPHPPHPALNGPLSNQAFQRHPRPTGEVTNVALGDEALRDEDAVQPDDED